MTLKVVALEAQRTRRGGAAMPNSRFKIQDPGLQKSLPEKQRTTILYHGEVRFRCGHRAALQYKAVNSCFLANILRSS